jgi:uncharacterized protein YuzE
MVEQEGASMAVMHMQDYLRLLPVVQDTPDRAVWLHYDDEADVLYVNFHRPSVATDSEMTDDDVIIRYDDAERVVGYTILHAQARGAV